MESQELVNPYAAAPEGKKKLLLWGLFFCVFGSICQSCTLSTMLPLAAQEIGGMEYYSLASTITGVISIVAMPLYGYIAAKDPAIKPKLMAVSYVIGAIVILARLFAPNMWVIVLAMMFWGFVSPATFVLGYSVIRDMYDQKKAGAYLGTCGTLMMLANVFGPMGGGALMTAFGWRVLNIVLLPFILVGAVLVLMGVKVTKEEMAPFARPVTRFDVMGTCGVTVFLAGVILGLSLGTNFVPFGSLWSNVLFVAAAIGLIVLVMAMRSRQEEAIIPLPAMKDRNVVALALCNFFAMCSNMALFFFLPSYIINVMGGSGFESGIAMACMCIVGVFMGPWVGRFIAKSGSARTSLLINYVARIAVAAVVILYLSPAASIVVVCLIMLVAGVYNIFNAVSFSAGPQIMIRDELRVQGNSVIQMAQNLGSGVAVAFYSVLIGIFGFMDGFPVAIGFSVAFAAIGIVCALFLRKLPNA